MRRLAGLLAEFREPIRADLLAHYGVDLAEWWQARRWRALLELIDQLPAASRFGAAVTSSPVWADQMLAAEIESEASGAVDPWAPPISEWNVQAEILAQIRDNVADNTRAVLASIPRKQGAPPARYDQKPFPRPRTALDEARDRRMREAGRRLMTWFFPSHAKEVDE